MENPDYFGNQPYAPEIRDALETRLIEVIRIGMGSDELAKISDAVDEAGDQLSADVGQAVATAIAREFEEISKFASEIDSESELEDYAKALEKLAPRARIPSRVVAAALKAVKSRIEEIAEEVLSAEAPSITGAINHDADKFDDAALHNLFAPLVAG